MTKATTELMKWQVCIKHYHYKRLKCYLINYSLKNFECCICRRKICWMNPQALDTFCQNRLPRKQDKTIYHKTYLYYGSMSPYFEHLVSPEICFEKKAVLHHSTIWLQLIVWRISILCRTFNIVEDAMRILSVC